MPGRFQLGLLTAALVAVGGCWNGASPPPAPIAPPAPKVVASPQSAPIESSPPLSAPSELSAVPPPPSEPPISSERILLLTPKTPLIVELQLTIDGRPHGDALDKLVAEALKLADTDADGRPTWKEITASKRFKYGQFGNLPVMGENDVKQVIERYDIDRDGLVDASELPRFLTRNAGGSRAFSVRGTADFRNTSRRDTPLWRAIDTDEDGTLSADEIAAAPARMLGQDLDDDEILTAADLNPPSTLNPGMMAERRRRGPEIVRLLGPHANWDSVRFLLEEQFGSPLAADSFPLLPDLFGKLDANKDGRLQKGEFAALNEVPPHLVVAVDFATRSASAGEGEAPAEPLPADSVPGAPTMKNSLRLVKIADELRAEGGLLLERPGRLTLAIAGTTLTLYLNDTLAAADYDAQVMQAMNLLDADKNGYLEEKELPEGAAAQFGRFEAVDADEDGKVFPAEIAAYLSQQQGALRAQIHAKAGDQGDPLFAALDQNHDERLDAREIDVASRRLAALDGDGDGQLAGDELPESLVLGLARGSLEQMDALFVSPPPAASGPADDAPRWFTAMDANGDGVVSPREFIGPAEKFPQVDANADGLVDLAEAKAVQQ